MQAVAEGTMQSKTRKTCACVSLFCFSFERVSLVRVQVCTHDFIQRTEGKVE